MNRVGVCVQAAAGSREVPSPTLSQELVASLLDALLTHDSNIVITRALKSQDLSTSPNATSNSNLEECIEAASMLEARLVAVEWSQIALVALQGTQVRCFSLSACP